MKKSILSLVIAAAGLLCVCSCSSTPPPPEKTDVDVSKMSPEERENYEAEQRAKQRVAEKQRMIPAKSHKGTQVTGEKTPLFQRNSVEKRKKLGDTTRPVLLNDDSSIFKWRDGGRRSDKLREQQQKRRESSTD